MSNYNTLKTADTINTVSIVDGAITTSKLGASVTTLIVAGGGPKATAITYPGNDLAADPAGGQTITLTGTGFVAGCSIFIGTVQASVVTVVSATSVTFTAPALAAATYTLYLVNPDGGTATIVPGISYSGTPTWSTSAGTLGSVYEYAAISNTVAATGDGSIVYSVFSGTLPTGSSLNTSTGVITGTSPASAGATTYTFVIRATDAQLQDSDRTFSITVNTDVVTWTTPADNSTTTLGKDAASSTTLLATSAAGNAITYTANTLPTGLSIVGAAVTGTPTVAASTTSTFTATAATTGRTATRTINWTVSVASDTYFPYTTLLLSGAAATETFVTDASTNNFVVTIAGDTKPDNFNPLTPGYYSNYFDGTGDYLTMTSNASLGFGTGLYTVECWVYATAAPALAVLFAVGAGGLQLALESGTGYIAIAQEGIGWLVSSSTLLPLNVWNHVAVSRADAGLTKIFLNGTQIATGTNTTNFLTGTYANINLNAGNSSKITGYISNVRIVKGTAVYTANFTPPTAPLTAIANTSLLTCQSNRFIDNSSNAFAVTAAGNTTISPTTPFVPNTQYAAYGSTYFDGTTDYLTVPITSSGPLDFGSGNWTVEAWVMYTGASLTGGYRNFLTFCNNSGAPYIQFGTKTSTGYVFAEEGTQSTVPWTVAGTTLLTSNVWHHIATVRNSNNIYLYLDGILQGSVAYSSAHQTFAKVQIGSLTYNGSVIQDWTGYISNARIVKGTAVYTAAFTPPTAPLTAVTGTSLLTVQTNQPASNSVFLDNSTNSFSVTRGGTTTQGTFSPYGANWSNYFAGTGANYLFLSGPQNFYDGKPLTVEGWFYAQSSADVQFAGNYENSGSGWTVQTYQQKIAVNLSGDAYDIVGTTTYALNTWHHFALSGTAGSWKLFVNGLQEGSTYTGSIALNSNAGLTIGGLRWSGANYSQLNGYISNLRIDQSNIYTSNFTPSTAPLPPTNTTYILTCNSNRLADTGPKDVQGILPFTGGTVSVQRFSPFSPQTQTAISYSGYFAGGATDYITVASGSSQLNLPGDFTVELWFNETNTTPTIPQFSGQTSGGFACGINSYDGGGARKLDWRQVAAAPVYGVTAITTNVWHHAAYVKSGSAFRIFLDGVLEYYSGSYSTTFTSTSTYIGTNGSGDTAYSFRGYISNFRVVKGTAVYTTSSTTIGATIFAVPTAPLTAIANTALLTCQSATFVDNSTNALVITSAGTATPRTVNPFGFTSATAAYSAAVYGGSAYYGIKTDYISVPATAPLTTFTGNFTFECWINPTDTSISTNWGIWDSRQTGQTASAMIFTLQALASPVTGQWRLSYYNSGSQYYGTGVVYANQWTHVAFVRSGSTLTYYVNGVAGGTTSVGAGTISGSATSNPVYIGTKDGSLGGYGNVGYISNFRIVNGTAVYTSNFVPPSAPLTAITNTSLLLNMTSAGVYDSASGNNLQTVADAKILATQTPYAGSYYSNYFDGSGDYLSVPSNAAFAFSTGNFTLEAWIYRTAVASDNFIFSASGSGGLFWGWDTNGNFGWGRTGVAWDYTVAPGIAVGSWYHVALTRSGTSMKMFVNGTQLGVTQSLATSYDISTTNLSIGSQGANYYFTGYISNARIVKGTAVYTSTFTPPALPATATQGTVSLSPPPTVEYLVVAGGGGGSSGGGGAGGLLTASGFAVAASTALTVTVGAGGAGGGTDSSNGTNGSNSVFSTLTAIGGGGGGSANPSLINGLAGGSGGGGAASGSATATGGSGTLGQGYAGASNGGFTSSPYGVGGGGGAGGVAVTVTSAAAFGGGAGLQSSITGTATYYAGGGGGGRYTGAQTAAPGGLGGGGSGSPGPSTASIAGTIYTGGGGGGSYNNGTGSAGGKGVVIIRHSDSYAIATCTGSPVITVVGGYKIYKFLDSGTITFNTETIAAVTGTQTSLLTCQSNRFIDNSTNAFTITKAGETSVQSFNPFQRNSGTSLYFDGTGDYLSVGTTLLNFLCTGSATGITATFEAWVYPTVYATGGSAWLFSSVYSKGATYLNFGVRNGAVRFYWYDGGAKNVDSASTGDVPLNTWTHIAVTIIGSTIKIYVNGVLNTTSATYTGVAAAGLNTTDLVGLEGSGTYFTGYINDLRITKGIARYTSTFSPPTTAFITK